MSILLRVRHHAEAERQARIMARLALETTGPIRITSPRPAGDPYALRGVPVVGVKGGIGGAIPGTKP
jgi:hypothetical protein